MGVATIHQHIPLVPSLSVIENIFLGSSGFWRADASLRRRFYALRDRIGYQLDPDALVSSLSIGARQMVAIFQALGTSSSLTSQRPRLRRRSARMVRTQPSPPSRWSKRPTFSFRQLTAGAQSAQFIRTCPTIRSHRLSRFPPQMFYGLHRCSSKERPLKKNSWIGSAPLAFGKWASTTP